MVSLSLNLLWYPIPFDFNVNVQFRHRVNWEEAVAKANLTGMSSEAVTNDSETVSQKRDEYITIYACIIAFATFFYTSRSFAFYRMFLRISINLHDMLFRGVSRAKMIFFNNNPSGRVLNRFAKDINNVDTLLPNVTFDICYVSILCV